MNLGSLAPGQSMCSSKVRLSPQIGSCTQAGMVRCPPARFPRATGGHRKWQPLNHTAFSLPPSPTLGSVSPPPLTAPPFFQVLRPRARKSGVTPHLLTASLSSPSANSARCFFQSGSRLCCFPAWDMLSLCDRGVKLGKGTGHVPVRFLLQLPVNL